MFFLLLDTRIAYVSETAAIEIAATTIPEVVTAPESELEGVRVSVTDGVKGAVAVGARATMIPGLAPPLARNIVIWPLAS